MRWPSAAHDLKERGDAIFALVHGRWRRVAEHYPTCTICGCVFAHVANKHSGRVCGADCRNQLTARRNGTQIGAANPHWKGYGGDYPWAEYRRRDLERHPERHLARQLTASAIRRGELVPAPCAQCGDPLSHPHHPDYAAPLVVVWLCHTHHREAHSGRAVGRKLTALPVANERSV